MEVVDTENESHRKDTTTTTTTDKQNGTATSKTNVSIYRSLNLQNNSVGEGASPSTQSLTDSPSSVAYLSDGMESTDSQKVTGLKIAISESADNGEIVINDEAQSPVLEDQLQKLREFDDFVDSLDKNGSQKGKSVAEDQRNGGSIQIETTVTNGKTIQSNISALDEAKRNDCDNEGTFSFETNSSGDPKSIIIDSSGVGGLMGLVSISPANSPIKRAPNSSTNQPNRAKTMVTSERTIESSPNESGSVTSSAKKSNNLFGMSSPSFSPPPSKSTPIDSVDLSLFDPHAPTKSPPAAKQSWVLFDEEDNDDRMSSSSRGTSMSSSSVKYQGMAAIPQSQFSPSPAHSGVGSPAGSGFVKDWIKFEAHLPGSTPNPQVVPQHTGGSIHSSLYSCEFLPDDRSDHQSDITASASASALSSHAGSFSGSHDNISHEYVPLESPKNMPASIPEGWIKFDETAATSPTESKIYFVGSAKPGHTRSQSAGGQYGNSVFGDNDKRRRASSTAMTSHLKSQPEELISSSSGLQSKVPAEKVSSPPPVHQPFVKENNLFQQQLLLQQKQHTPDVTQGAKVQQHVPLPDQTNITTQVHSENVTNIQQVQSQPLLQQQLLQQQQQILLLQQQQQHQIQKQKLATVGRQLQQIQEQQLIQTSPVESQSASSQPGSVASQSPVVGAGNPFREEFLQQQQQSAGSYPATKASSTSDINITPRSATSSPFNPFRLSNNGSNGESKTVSASSTWETFDDPKKGQQVTSSPGNPFKQMMITANVHPQNKSEQAVYETIQEPRYIVMPETKTVSSDSKPPQLPEGHPLSSPTKSVPQTPTTLIKLAEQVSETPQVLNNQTSAASNTNSQSVAFQKYVENLGDSGVTSSGQRPETSTQQQPTEGSAVTFVDEYPRDEVDPTEGWPLMLRCPDKKKLTSSRYWKPVHVRLMDGNVIQLFDDRTRKEPFRELPLQSNYEFGDRRLQAYDTRGKIHTIKIFYVSYKEKKRFSSLDTQDKILHSEPLIKLGSTFYDVFKSFIYSVNEALMKLTAFRDRGRHYEQDMMTVTVCDDYRGYIDYSGEVLKQSITTDVTVLAFLSGMPACAIGLNDAQVRGAEIVSRRDIIPNKTNEWIKLENLVLHKCANKNVFTESRFIEFSPLDGCRFKLLQFKSRPKSKELPMYIKVKVSGENNHIDMRADLYMPARTGKQNINHHVCENIMVRVPLPEAWIRYFRKEKRIKGFSSIKSVTKKADQIKSGSKPKLIEVSVGSAKYEHAYRAVVWRIDRIPQKYTSMAVTHIMRVQLDLRSMNELPVTFFRNTEVEFTMPHTTASKTTVRSLAVATDTSPDKRVRYTAKYEYQVEIEKSFDLPADDKASECVMQ